MHGSGEEWKCVDGMLQVVEVYGRMKNTGGGIVYKFE